MEKTCRILDFASAAVVMVIMGACLLLFTGCATVGGKDGGVADAVRTERQSDVAAGFHATPRDGVWMRSQFRDALRNPDKSIWMDKSGNPIPIAGEFSGAWNLNNDSLGGLSQAEIQFGQYHHEDGMTFPGGLSVKIGGSDVKTSTSSAAILAGGQAEAAAKAAAGDAGAKILREHYAGKVQLMKVGTEWLVQIKDGAFGVLERVNPVAAGVALSKEAAVILKDRSGATVTETVVNE